MRIDARVSFIEQVVQLFAQRPKFSFYMKKPPSLIDVCYEIVINTSEQEKELYKLEKDQMALFHTSMKGTLI